MLLLAALVFSNRLGPTWLEDRRFSAPRSCGVWLFYGLGRRMVTNSKKLVVTQMGVLRSKLADFESARSFPRISPSISLSIPLARRERIFFQNPPGRTFRARLPLATHFAPRRALVRAENHRQVEVADGTNLGKNRPSNERSEYRSREA